MRNNKFFRCTKNGNKNLFIIEVKNGEIIQKFEFQSSLNGICNFSRNRIFATFERSRKLKILSWPSENTSFWICYLEGKVNIKKEDDSTPLTIFFRGKNGELQTFQIPFLSFEIFQNFNTFSTTKKKTIFQQKSVVFWKKNFGHFY
jgi:hypothetical protein